MINTISMMLTVPLSSQCLRKMSGSRKIIGGLLFSNPHSKFENHLAPPPSLMTTRGSEWGKEEISITSRAHVYSLMCAFYHGRLH